MVLKISWQTKAGAIWSCLTDFVLREVVQRQPAQSCAWAARIVPWQNIYLMMDSLQPSAVLAPSMLSPVSWTLLQPHCALPAAVAQSHLSGSQPDFPFPVFPQSRSKRGQIPAVFFILQLAGSNSSLWVSPGISAEIPSSRLVNRSSFKTLSLSPKWKSILQV